MELIREELIALRRELHQFPEVSGSEKETSKRILSFLNRYAPDEIITNLGGFGIAAVYKGANPGKNILFRCELDALPITEINSVPHTSRIFGNGHMCGHDGHMAIVSGLAVMLSEQRPVNGNVILLFQPAEENGKGAKAVLSDERFRKLKPDMVFALHNLPGYPKHDVVLKRGSFTAAVNSLTVRLIGKTSHAGEPDKGINPAQAMAEIIQEVHKLNIPDQNSEQFRQITYVYASMGEKAYGISAGQGELGFTFRCWSTKERDLLGEEMADIAKAAAKKYGLRVEVAYTESFHANRNADEAIDIVEKVAIGNKVTTVWKDLPHRWGEDFGIFTEEYPGALFGLGAGEETPALHNPDYDFPDEIIETGVKMFLGIIEESNK